MSADTAPAPIRHAPVALWRVAQAFLHMLHALFGAPEDVAAKHTFKRHAHAQLASWLRCAEAMLRRLLLIEASAYPKPNTRPLLHTRRQRVRKLMGFSAEQPEAWRVSFRCLQKESGLSARRNRQLPAGSRQSSRFCSAWPLAERYEALLRVFNDPTACARRLSRRLHATPHRLSEALRAPPDAGERVDQFDALTELAGAAWRPHLRSG